MSTLPRAYSYVRFSTPEQAEGDSLRRQTELSTRYAEAHGLTIDTSLSLHDKGLSGFTGENRSKGALSVFLKAVEAGLVPLGSFLLVESLDRLSRDTLSEQMGLFIGLINAGLTVVTLADGQSYSKTTIDSDLSKLMLSLVVMMRAHEESLTKSRRLKAAWEDKRRRISEEKLTACCPSWLRLASDRSRFVVIPERAELVGRVYQMSIDGYGVALIAQTLNSERISSWSKGQGWHVSFVHRLLRNRAVLGEFQPLRREGLRSISIGAPVPDYYPAIVNAATWQKAQERRQTSTPGRTGKPIINLFAGIIFDGYNGSSMRLIRWNRTQAAVNSSDHGYYLVSDYGRLGTGHRSVSWRYSWLEGWVLDYLVHLDWSALSEEKARTEQSALEVQLTGLREKSAQTQAELIRLLRLAKSIDLPPETLLQEMQQLEKEQKRVFRVVAELEARIEAITAKQASAAAEQDQIEELAQAGDGRSRLRLREAIRQRVRRIDVFPNGNSQQQLGADPVRALDLPCFRITFFNEVVRWVHCPTRKSSSKEPTLRNGTVP